MIDIAGRRPRRRGGQSHRLKCLSARFVIDICGAAHVTQDADVRGSLKCLSARFVIDIRRNPGADGVFRRGGVSNAFRLDS